MLVKEVMTTDVKTIEPSGTVQEAAEMMREQGIGCLVVVVRDRLAGILTDSDILSKVVAEDRLPSKVRVSDVMTKKLILIKENADISDAAELMEKHKVKKLPVVSGSNLVGILTVADLAQAEPKLIQQISSLLLMPKQTKGMAG